MLSLLESLLRKPVEWWSSIASLLAAGLVLFTPLLILLTPVWAYGVATILVALSFYRGVQGFKIVHYQRHLNQLPRYELSSNDIPVSHKKLFLGKGFRWQMHHTQRLYECQQRNAARYLKKSQSISSSLGGNTILHGVECREESVSLNLSERVGHMLVLGTTRVGKTRFLEVMVTQDIRRGDVVVVFDPKGDTDLLKRIIQEAKLADRESDLVIFHLGFPSVSARYNPIGHFARVTEVANRLTHQLPSSGESAAFKEFAWRFVNIIAKALVALGRRPDYKQIQRYILQIDSLLLDYCRIWLPTCDPLWQEKIIATQEKIDERHLPLHLKTRSRHVMAIVKTIQQEGWQDDIGEGLCSAFNYDKTYFDKLTASLLPLLDKLTTGKIAELISPNYEDLEEKRPVFDWMQVIKSKKIVYVGLDALSDSTIASAVGSSMLSDLCSVAGQLYKFGLDKNTSKKQLYHISVHADEFNEIVNEDVTTLLNKGGGAGFQLSLYTQTWSDIEAKLGNSAKAAQIAGNLNTIICFRVINEETASFFTSKLPQRVPIFSLNTISSTNDTIKNNASFGFTSNNQDRVLRTEVPMLMPHDLLQLPKGQFFCLMHGGQLWKVLVPLPKGLNLEDGVEQLMKMSLFTG